MSIFYKLKSIDFLKATHLSSSPLWLEEAVPEHMSHEEILL
jgi:hypothetical protein